MDHNVAHHSRTRRLLWVMLVCATAASMAGNVAHAWAHQSAALAAGAVVAAGIPPLALLSLTHLAGMWSRISARGVVYWCFLIAVSCITAAAFRLSFDALRSLAMQYGYSRADAALFPLILDGLVAVCTLGLVVLSRIDAPMQLDAADAGHTAAAMQSRVPGADAATGSVDLPPAVLDPNHAMASLTSGDAPIWARRGAAAACAAGDDAGMRRREAATVWPVPAVAAPQRRDSGEPPREAAVPGADDAQLRLARHLVDAGRTTVDAAVVHQVLERTTAGQSSRTVAAGTGLSPSSVQRIVKAARELEPAGT